MSVCSQGWYGMTTDPHDRTRHMPVTDRVPSQAPSPSAPHPPDTRPLPVPPKSCRIRERCDDRDPINAIVTATGGLLCGARLLTAMVRWPAIISP